MPKTTLIRKQATPTGTIQPLAGDVIPDGYLVCDGSIVNIADYPRLYAIIGTAHGHGNEVSPGVSDGLTFHLPDLRGRFLRGTDANAGRDLDAGARTPGNAGGNAGDNVGSVQDDKFKTHGHRMWKAALAGDANPILYPSAGVTGESSGSSFYYANDTDNPDIEGMIEPAQGGSDTRPTNVNVNYIIKAV